MAPLDGFTYSPLPSETYITFHDSHWNRDYYILSQRDVIVGTNPLYDFGAPPVESSRTQHKTNSFQSFMELFTDNLCLCPHQQQRRRHQRTTGCADTFPGDPSAPSLPIRKNVVYPVARYPDRLNSPQMVQQRRKSLQECSTFIPVVVE
jgi:hypothetical protein